MCVYSILVFAACALWWWGGIIPRIGSFRGTVARKCMAYLKSDKITWKFLLIHFHVPKCYNVIKHSENVIFLKITYKGKSLVRKIRRTAFCQVSQDSLKIIVVKEILLKKKKKKKNFEGASRQFSCWEWYISSTCHPHFTLHS